MRLPVAAALAALSLFAQAPEPVAWKVLPPATRVKPGTRFQVKVIAQIQSGWHIYGLRPVADGPVATRIWVADGQAVLSAGAVEGTDPQTMLDPSFGMEVQLYEGEATFTVPLRLAATATTGEQKYRVNASYQTCDNKICLPPKTVKLEVPVTVAQ
jgi:DsbC/DsbD-like thiol-disulfide interchange protein